MAETSTAHGLNCPRCGGTVPVPEGQPIVICPYCDLRALVKGDRGIRRYQLKRQVDLPAASARLGKFLGSNWAIALNARRQAELSEAFLAYIPFWTAWARTLAWVFGKERVGSGKRQRWEPRERQITREMIWTGAACDVAELGVNQVPLTLSAPELAAFDAEQLHAEGLVFEPVASQSDAQQAAQRDFSNQVQAEAGIDKVSQAFVRYLNERFGLVYYPLWVLRYLYRGRAYQLVVDGHSGELLYGRAPGNTLYRAAVLVAGMALGAFLAVNGSLLGLYLMANADGDDAEGLLALILVAVVFGGGLIYAAYRAFRYGEVYEFQKYGNRPDHTNLFDTVKRWMA